MSAFEDKIISKLSHELEIAEASRKTAIRARNNAIYLSSIIIILSLVATYFITAKSDNILIFLLPLVAASFGSYHIYKGLTTKPKENFQYVYKNIVIQNIADELQSGMNFFPERGLSRSVFKDSRHYLSGVDRFSSEDLFEGETGSTSVMFSEVHAEFRTDSEDLKGDVSIRWSTIFKGMLYVADFHKNFSSWVIIKPEGIGNWATEKALGMSNELKILEDPEFEKYFRVYGGDEVMTRYILTPDMQQRICDLRKVLGPGMMMSFLDSKVYLTVPHSNDWFEFNMHISAKCKQQMSSMINQMNLYFQIVEALDLNTRIWTKE